ncbi:hypothetical protein AB0H12_43085 [Actinosynnema sp. NPDC023794]
MLGGIARGRPARVAGDAPLSCVSASPEVNHLRPAPLREPGELQAPIRKDAMISVNVALIW